MPIRLSWVGRRSKRQWITVRMAAAAPQYRAQIASQGFTLIHCSLSKLKLEARVFHTPKSRHGRILCRGSRRWRSQPARSGPRQFDRLRGHSQPATVLVRRASSEAGQSLVSQAVQSCRLQRATLAVAELGDGRPLSAFRPDFRSVRSKDPHACLRRSLGSDRRQIHERQ
jgi:hypothetical protein